MESLQARACKEVSSVQPHGESSQTCTEESADLAELPLHWCTQHGNKQEELEVCVQFLDYDLIGIIET